MGTVVDHDEFNTLRLIKRSIGWYEAQEDTDKYQDAAMRERKMYRERLRRLADE